MEKELLRTLKSSDVCIHEFSYLDFVVNLLDMIQWNPLKHKFHVASDRT